jgi:hypothetical protein
MMSFESKKAVTESLKDTFVNDTTMTVDDIRKSQDEICLSSNDRGMTPNDTRSLSNDKDLIITNDFVMHDDSSMTSNDNSPVLGDKEIPTPTLSVGAERVSFSKETDRRLA